MIAFHAGFVERATRIEAPVDCEPLRGVCVDRACHRGGGDQNERETQDAARHANPDRPRLADAGPQPMMA
jgi:hypothetical protein